MTDELMPGLRWWRVLGGAVLIEAGLMVVSVPFVAIGLAESLQAIVPSLTVPIAFLAGLWVARGTLRPIANAALAGAVAVPVYLVIVVFAIVAQPGVADTSTALSPAYLATHALKVLGSAAGGWRVARRRAAAR